MVTRACPGEGPWQELIDAWLEPTLVELRAGGLDALWLSAGQVRFELKRRHLMRFWRRARAWWHYVE